MTPREAVAQLSQPMAAAGLEEPRLQAELLVMRILGLDRARLYTLWQDQVIELASWQGLQGLLERRLACEPLAYLLGRQEFFGLEFSVDSRVLIPRPETELLVEQAIQCALARHPRGRCAIADVGTGSGAVAVSLAVRLPEALVFATDVSPEAASVAKENCRRHGVEQQVQVLEGDLLSPLPQPVDLVVSNPPYVRDAELILRARELQNEPEVAFRGGPQGLSVIERLLCQAREKLAPGAVLLVEFAPSQAAGVRALAEAAFPEAHRELVRDLMGWQRVLLVQT